MGRPAVDARSVGTQQPSSRAQITRSSQNFRNRQIVDARSMGVREPSSGPRITRTSDGPRPLIRRGTSGLKVQGGIGSGESARASQGPIKRRTGEDTGSDSPGGFQKPIQAQGDSHSSSSRRDRHEGAPLDIEETKYLQAQINDSASLESLLGLKPPHTKSDEPTMYAPAEVSSAVLEGLGPAVPCGEWGMSETIRENLNRVNTKQENYDERIELLASQYGEGNNVSFKSKKEKEDTLRLITRNLAGVGDNAEIDESEEEKRMALVDMKMKEAGEKMTERLLRGKYTVGPLGKGATAELLEKYTRKNKTYSPRDQDQLVARVGTLLPLGVKTPKVEVEAPAA